MAINIEAAVLTEIDAPLQIRSLTHEKLGDGQVLVELAFSGLCGSQLLEVNGKRGPDRFLPHLLGHEGSGVVKAVGNGVTKVKPGDHVVATWIASEGINSGGTSYTDSEGQTVNAGPIATFSNSAVISENRLVAIDNKFPLDQAALLGCCIPTGAGTVLNLANVHNGDSIAILGVGGVGLSAVVGAKMANAKTIVAIDKNDNNLALAIKLGATHTINPDRQNVGEESSKLMKNGLFNATVEASGHPAVMELAIQIKNVNGTCVIAGNPKTGTTIKIDPFDLIKGKKIVGSWGGGSSPDKDIPKFVEAQISGATDFSPLLGSIYDLRRINDAVSELEQGTAGRILIRLS